MMRDPDPALARRRVRALASGQLLGFTNAQWSGPDGRWRDTWNDDDPPHFARVGVWRRGLRGAVYAVASWREMADHVATAGGEQPAPAWTRFASTLLAEAAEAAAIDRAFPSGL